MLGMVAVEPTRPKAASAWLGLHRELASWGRVSCIDAVGSLSSTARKEEQERALLDFRRVYIYFFSRLGKASYDP